jgi:integrator complex subunit 1
MNLQDMAQLIVERATLINHLLPQEGFVNECAERVLVAMIELFYVYLTKAQQPQNEAFQWVCN